MRLHEIELFSTDPEASKAFFGDTVGLSLNVDEPGLKVFNAGLDGVDLNISNHYPSSKISLSFLVKNIDEYIEVMKQRNIQLTEPYDSHLGLKAVSLSDTGDCRIVIHSPTDTSPEWLRNMV